MRVYQFRHPGTSERGKVTDPITLGQRQSPVQPGITPNPMSRGSEGVLCGGVSASMGARAEGSPRRRLPASMEACADWGLR